MFLAISIIVILANLYLGLAIFVRNKKSATHRLFFLFTILSALWIFTNYFTVLPGTADEILFRVRVLLVVVAFWPPALLLLAHTFPSNTLRMKQPYHIALWAFAGITALLSATPFVYQSMEIVGGMPVPVIAPGFLFVAVNGFLIPIIAFILLYRKHRVSSGRTRGQMKFFMLGIGLYILVTMVTNFVFIYLLQDTSMVVYGPLASILSVAFVFYAIVKHRFLDIRMVVFRSVSYVALLIIVTLFYIFGAMVILRGFFPDTAFSQETLWIMLIFSFVVAMSAQPLLRGIQHYLGKYFFKSLYRSDHLLFRIMKIFAAEIDVDISIPKVLGVVTNTIGISKGAVIIVENHKVTGVENVGFSQEAFDDIHQLQILENVFHDKHHHELIVFEDVKDNALKEVLRQWDIEVLLPIKIGDEEIALVAFGGRSSGDMYTHQDIDVLRVIAGQIGDNILSTRKFRMLKIVETTKSDFVHSVSHEFRTPLTEMSWRIESLLSPEYREHLSEPLKKDLESAYLSIGWLISSLNQLNTVVDLETKQTALSYDTVDLQALIKDDVFLRLDELAQMKKLSVEWIADTDETTVRADVDKIREVFLIVIKNAILYSSDNATVTVRCTSRHNDIGENFIRIAIEDTGIGISEEDFLNLFSKFYRGEAARRAVPNGLGVGLYIAKKIIHLHRGKIWAEPSEDKTVFFVELPREV